MENEFSHRRHKSRNSTHAAPRCVFQPPVPDGRTTCVVPLFPYRSAAPAFPAAVSSPSWPGKIQQENRESDNEAIIRSLMENLFQATPAAVDSILGSLWGDMFIKSVTGCFVDAHVSKHQCQASCGSIIRRCIHEKIYLIMRFRLRGTRQLSKYPFSVFWRN